jgi:hypothetical protein
MKAETEAEPRPSGRAESNLRVRRVFPVFVVLAAVLLIAEHRLHVLGYLPWLILLACPLMHVFMHHGHGHNGKRTAAADDGSRHAQSHRDRNE